MGLENDLQKTIALGSEVHHQSVCTYIHMISLQEMISNAILRDLMQRKSVTRDMFRDNHPGGSIGRILAQMK